MSTPIKNGHELDLSDRIIKLGQDLYGSSARTIVIDKRGGKYVLTITTRSSRDEETYDLVSKIPPDTNARVRIAKVKKKK